MKPLPAAIAWADIPSLLVNILQHTPSHRHTVTTIPLLSHLLAPAEMRYLVVSTLLKPAANISGVQPPEVTALTLAPLLTISLQMLVCPSLAEKWRGLQSEVARALGAAPELRSSRATSSAPSLQTSDSYQSVGQSTSLNVKLLTWPRCEATSWSRWR